MPRMRSGVVFVALTAAACGSESSLPSPAGGGASGAGGAALGAEAGATRDAEITADTGLPPVPDAGGDAGMPPGLLGHCRAGAAGGGTYYVDGSKGHDDAAG